MSFEKRLHEARRWYQTARDDLDTAKVLLDNNKFSASCFHSQQAAEKALKAICFLFGMDTWGHSIVKLTDVLRTHKQTATKVLSYRKEAMALDRYYIPTRYPDGLPDITPMDAYNVDDAETALKYSGHFLDLAHEVIEG